MEENKSSESQVKEKKPRKRMKAIYSQIKQQMEFYFSDSNLNRDRFMNKQIQESEDRFVDLELFLKFNKIKNLTLDSNVIATALKHSDLLQVSEDGQKVKRTKPLSSPQDIDDRTIYVECLPHSVDHEWIRRIFSSCGTVLYVSIPRYKTTGDSKGFAFVEFDSIEAASKACEDLNNPPAEASEKPGKFPRTSKQLIHLQKSVGSKDDGNLSHEKNLPESPTKSAKKRRRRHRTSECSDGENVEVSSKHRKLDFEKKEQNLNAPQEQGVDKHELNSSKSVEGEEKDVSRKKNKKRKRSKGEGQSSVTESETSDQLSVEESDKESRKRKICDSTEDDRALPSKLLKSEKNCAKVNDNKENSGTKANLDNKSDGTTEDTCSKEKKKKKKRNHKTKHREKDIPELRVISKKEWLGLKAEYLKLQKESMNELKKTLTLMKKDKDEEEMNTPEEKKSEEVDKGPERPKIEFVPNVIVYITSGRSMYRKDVKEDLGTDYQIAYIDLKEGEKVGYIRMKDENSAKNLAAADSGSYFFTLLQGQEEKDYWDKLEADRNTKFTSKHNKKKRGSQKLVDKAQKINKDNITRTHVKFDD